MISTDPFDDLIALSMIAFLGALVIAPMRSFARCSIIIRVGYYAGAVAFALTMIYRSLVEPVHRNDVASAVSAAVSFLGAAVMLASTWAARKAQPR